MVKDDAKSVTEVSKILLSNLSKIDKKLLTEKLVYDHWISLEKGIKASAISISKRATIKIQRNHFKHLSAYLTNAIEIFGIKTHC